MKSSDQGEHSGEGFRYAGPSGASPRSHEIVVSERSLVRFLMWTGLPLLGLGAGWLVKQFAGWVASLPWAPLQGPFELTHRLIVSFGEPQATIGALSLGAVAGLALAFVAERESLTVTISQDRMTSKRGESSLKVERASVGCIFVDGNDLVVLGHGTEELLREPFDLDPDELREALVACGYPWREGGDPYKDDYRLWVEDTPELPPAAGALLKARARALARDEGEEDTTVLRTELARFGIVVRDERNHQYWRRTGEHRSHR